jgi:hypothetical protein
MKSTKAPTNNEGLTLIEWLAAAQAPDVKCYVQAWERGDDPTDHRAQRSSFPAVEPRDLVQVHIFRWWSKTNGWSRYGVHLMHNGKLIAKSSDVGGESNGRIWALDILRCMRQVPLWITRWYELRDDYKVWVLEDISDVSAKEYKRLEACELQPYAK